ncbi:MAG TPA: Gfo/Idh/MocA family oxidoreductase [Pseudonocardiaceae bacterium]
MAGCRIGFVGAGGVASRHAQTLALIPQAHLVAVTDVDPVRAARFAEYYGVRAAPDLDDLLNAGLDAVYVCVPPFAHGAVEEAVANAGMALFVEKPLGIDCAVAERVARAVAQAGVVTATGHHWRYSAAVEQAQRSLADRPRRLVIGSWLDRVPPVGWWSQRSRSGGQIVEQAVHVLDLARLLVGEVAEVSALTDGVPPDEPGADIDGVTVALLRFCGGAVGTLAASCRLSWKHRAGIEVYADGSTLSITEDELQIRSSADGSTPRTTAVLPEDAKTAADLAFVEAVLGIADDVRAPYQEALRTHRLACAVATSAATGQSVQLVGEHSAG